MAENKEAATAGDESYSPFIGQFWRQFKLQLRQLAGFSLLFVSYRHACRLEARA